VKKIIPVILSGGSGVRLWPLSRKQHPKQYLSLVGDKTMLQETILRLEGLSNLSDPIIICNTDHRFLVADQCRQIKVKNPTILLEPVGRNTAPAIAASAWYSIKELDKDAILLVLSADHMIFDVQAFYKAIDVALKQAKNGKLVTFGVVPTSANIGYGYIKFSKNNIDDAYKVDSFSEKPDKKTAQFYVNQGNYLWNSGMFMFQASVVIDELNVHAPDMVEVVEKSINNSMRDLDFVRLEEGSFKASLNDSIDYVLMEKSNNTVVVPLDAGWSDVGSWSALYDIGEKDNNNNVVQGDVYTEETKNTYISANSHMVAAIGVQDLIIVDTPNAVLISSRDKTHKVKKIVEQLQKQDRKEQLYHRKVYRPWGWYDSIELGVYFQVKKLCINPGARLSLQKHFKRAEHWVVVSGVASITNGDNVFILTRGESTYIPIGVKHSLENKSNTLLEVVEVQSGSYLGEDDIVRYEDDYGRK